MSVKPLDSHLYVVQYGRTTVYRGFDRDRAYHAFGYWDELGAITGQVCILSKDGATKRRSLRSYAPKSAILAAHCKRAGIPCVNIQLVTSDQETAVS